MSTEKISRLIGTVITGGLVGWVAFRLYEGTVLAGLAMLLIATAGIGMLFSLPRPNHREYIITGMLSAFATGSVAGFLVATRDLDPGTEGVTGWDGFLTGFITTFVPSLASLAIGATALWFFRRRSHTE
jgi:hypothetical protein